MLDWESYEQKLDVLCLPGIRSSGWASHMRGASRVIGQFEGCRTRCEREYVSWEWGCEGECQCNFKC
jgi:hypothetical protein